MTHEASYEMRNGLKNEVSVERSYECDHMNLRSWRTEGSVHGSDRSRRSSVEVKKGFMQSSILERCGTVLLQYQVSVHFHSIDSCDE